MKAYQDLKQSFQRLHYLSKTIALLDWDHETYLPRKGVGYRADQQAFLSGLAHERLTSSQVGELIAACEAQLHELSSEEQANVRCWRKDHDKATKLPTAFVEKMERRCSLAKASWAEARQAGQFERFQEDLSALIDLSREKAQYYGGGDHPYDALMDLYEPGATCAQLDPILSALKDFVVSFLPTAMEKTQSVDASFLQGDYPIEGQLAFNEEVARAVGFDLEAGRIDATVHPFCTDLGPQDIRLTTRYDKRDFAVSLYSVLHEAGHGLYEQGFKAEHVATPMGESVSLGIHESQSRLWENKVGRSLAFWEDWYDAACRHLPSLQSFSPEQITLAVNRVSPSFIRVEADEVTYDLHIILRYEMEKALIAGDLQVKDVPGEWNERFKAMFGLEVRNDAQGCLQDIHWSMGGFGYFPTYTLGNLNSAQLFASARSALGTSLHRMDQGAYVALLDWLRRQVHQHGRQHEPDELMKLATGKSTDPLMHQAYLKERFDSLSA